MIPRLLELIRRAGARGDLVAKQEETLVLELVDGALARASLLHERGVNLRVLREGKAGVAGTTDDDAAAVVAAALEAAEQGPPAEVELPEAGAELTGFDAPGQLHPCRRKAEGTEHLGDLGGGAKPAEYLELVQRHQELRLVVGVPITTGGITQRDAGGLLGGETGGGGGEVGMQL